MKKWFGLILLCVAFTFSSCKKESAEEVAENFVVAFHNMDFAKAKTYATETSAKQLDELAQMEAGLPKMAKDDAKKVIITMGRGQESGDKATFFYTPSDNPIAQKVNLVKVKGEWKVEWNKNDNVEANLKALEFENQSSGTPRENKPNETINIQVDSSELNK